MKPRILPAVSLAAILTIPALSGYSQSNTVSAPPPVATPVALPPSASEVMKLAQSGMSDDVIVAYIKNSQAYFNLTANDILVLRDAGLSSPVIRAMINHDSALNQQRNAARDVSGTASAIAPTPPASAAAPSVSVTAQPATPPPATVVVDQPPPPTRVEVIPVSPGPEFVWVPGYWSWRGGVWMWVGGSYVHRPRPGVIWVGGHWAHRGHSYVWIGGRWR